MLLVACLGGSPGQRLGARCDGDEGCREGLLCVYGRCRSACVFDRDCPAGAVCVAAPGREGRVCTLEDEGPTSVLPCPEGLARDPDGFCRELCAGGLCEDGRVCAGRVCVEPDAADGGVDADADADADMDADADAVLDAPADGEGELDSGDADLADGGLDADAEPDLPATNLLLPANGGVLLASPSSWCVPTGHHSNCASDYWLPSNLNDGELATADCDQQNRASWASDDKGLVPGPEVITFGFGRGAGLALVERLVIQNYGEEGCNSAHYYSSEIEVLADGAAIHRGSLPADTSLQTLDLVAMTGAPVECRALTVTVISGCTACDPIAVELGEIEAWGWLL